LASQKSGHFTLSEIAVLPRANLKQLLEGLRHIISAA